MSHRWILPALLAGVCLVATPALAGESFRFDSDRGLLTLSISPDGTVHGYYPGRDGRITGRMTRDGTIRGWWLQSEAASPCGVRRFNARAWGAFEMSNPYRDTVEMRYGYCEEQASRAWDVTPRR